MTRGSSGLGCGDWM